MLNIIDLESQFSKQKINKAKKLSLREIEEDKKNHFICFVDEGEESYDAQISINEKLEIIDSSCDCSDQGFCNHLLALAIHIFEIKNILNRKNIKLKIFQNNFAVRGSSLARSSISSAFTGG